MTKGRVKPSLFFLDHGGTVESIPYEDGFEYDEDENPIFGAEAWTSGNGVYIEMTGCAVCFDLDALLGDMVSAVRSSDYDGDAHEDKVELLEMLKRHIGILEA